uniref:Serine protease inhibitor n=1 Tax=Steinernema carpocapsae TaxID=34508 RepID=E2IPQ9_STECR|nr:serine protease inhibitor precursor [Steinernema carpocapsae]ADY11211.1 serine protease inhibitor [Steinernema carpocapsae]
MRSLPIFLCLVGLCLALPTPKTNADIDAQMNDALFRLSLNALKTKGNEASVVSPFSVAMALATVNDGALGKTSQEITDVAFKGIPKDQVTAWFKNKIAEFKSEYNSPTSIASAIYVEKTLQVIEKYLTDLKDNYQTGLEKADFVSNPQAERTKINNFVNETTAGHIPELFAKDQITTDTRLVAVNAIYMKSAFDDNFPKSETKNLPFNNEDGSNKQLETMNGTQDGRFYENEDFEFGDMPFKDRGYNFFLIVPKENIKLSQLQDKFISSGQKFSASNSAAKGYMYLQVTVPKFNVSADLELKSILNGLGIKEVFQRGAANLKGISAEPLYVEHLVHKAVMELDEKGVTAAAATGVGIALMSAKICMDDCHAEINADRPFLYGVSHRGTPLFVGHFY